MNATCGCLQAGDCPSGQACDPASHECSSSCAGGLTCNGGCCAGGACVACPTAGVFAEFGVPTASGRPTGIAAGPDGNLWFTEIGGNEIGRITPTGTITEFAIPSSGATPLAIAAGSDGNLWFVESSTNKIGRITPTGTITGSSGSRPRTRRRARVHAGPDGALWFTEPNSGVNKIGRVTTGGSFTDFAIPTSQSYPEAITAGPDGALWFGEAGLQHRSVQHCPRHDDGVLHHVRRSHVDGRAAGDHDLGPDGNVWFTDYNGNRIGRVTTGGSFTEFFVGGGSNPVGITAGPDGEPLVVVAGGNDKVGRITTAGTMTLYPIPTSGAGPNAIVTGPDGNLWFTELEGNKIGRVTP